MSVTINASTSAGLIQTADTSGTVEIQSNGTTKFTVATTGAYGQLVSDTAKTATSTSVDFTGIPSWVKRITVMLQGVSTNGTSNYLIQVGTSSGVTTSGYLGGFSNIAGGFNSTAGFGVTAGGAGVVMHGSMQINNITGNSWVASHSMGRSDAASISVGGGSVSLSGTLDRVRITTVNGTDTFDAGSINILYEG